jgi:chromosome partitioning protein
VVANQKGGVGKTTTAVHLAHGLALAGAQVVLLDLDPQGNATLALEAMDGQQPESTEGPFAVLRALDAGFWMLPSPGARRNLNRDTRPDATGLLRLTSELARAGVDWLIVDSPPRMDLWGWTGLRLCDEVVVPVQAEFFSMHGLSQMMSTLEAAAREYPGKARLLGVLVTMFDMREQVAIDVLEDLRSNLGVQVLDSVVFRDPQLVEAASHGVTAFQYNVFSKGARCYGELVREVMHGRATSR